MKNSRKGNLTVSQKLSNALQMPIDVVANEPYIKICSNREVIVEKAGKLVHYERNVVKVARRNSVISINGRDLKIARLCDGNLKVCGYLTSLCFE